MNNNRCVMCGDVIPEGTQVCKNCEKVVLSDKRKEFLNALCDI